MKEPLLCRIQDYIRKVKNRNICPICGYTFKTCQCRFVGSARPDGYKNQSVVYEHLYLLSLRQLIHVLKIQKYLQISYGDIDKERMLNRLKSFGGTND